MLNDVYNGVRSKELGSVVRTKELGSAVSFIFSFIFS